MLNIFSTGKTETVKSLGALFGRQVLVFNCDDQLTCASIGRMFMGLIMSGAWGCFDEFNRLKADQLSAIADQIQAIQYGLKTRQKNVEIMKKCVQINHNAAIFTTMNPAGREYGGRSQLPSNLKALFRPVAMEMPDIYKIAEVALLSYGFCHSKLLGLKVIFIFKTAQKMLSKARHYDWGLRSVKSVIRKAGILRRERCRNDTIECSDILEKEVSVSSTID
jgi:dynein heavy chain 2